MRQSATIVKAVTVFISAAVILWSDKPGFVFQILAIFTLPAAFLVRIPAVPFSRFIPFLVFYILAFSLSLRPVLVQPPDLWFMHSDGAASERNSRPDYSKALAAEARILKEISPGRYLARVRILYTEHKTSFYKKKRKITYYKKNIPENQDDLKSFPVYININDDTLHSGCFLYLRIFGRAVPKRMDPATESGRSFALYLRRIGAVSYLKLSSKYHVRQKNCAYPSFREKAVFKMKEILDLKSGLSEDSLAAAKGMVLGKAGFLDYDFRKKAQVMGILHLFAASGLHLGIFYAVLYLPLSFLTGKKHPISLLLPLAAAAGYLWLLQFPVSLSRAFLFLAFFAFFSVNGRRVLTGDHILNAALLILILNPSETVTLSGALSFGAVTGILFFYRPIRDSLPDPFRNSGPRSEKKVKRKIMEFIYQNLSVSTAAALLTTPFLLGSFGIHSFASQMINMIVVPLTGLVLPLIYILIAAELILPDLPEFFWIPVQAGMGLFDRIVEHGARYSLFYEYASLFSFPFAAAFLLSGVLIFSRHFHSGDSASDKNTNRRMQQRIRMVVFILILLLGPVGYLVSGVFQGRAVFFGKEGKQFQLSVKETPEKNDADSDGSARFSLLQPQQH